MPRWAPSALLALSLLLWPTLVGLAGTARAEPDESSCFACHNNPEWQMELTLPSGEDWLLYFDQDKLETSVHGFLTCTDCHTEISDFPHRDLPEEWDRRDIGVQLATSCQRCHLEQYQDYVSGVHGQAFAGGRELAPVCTDCHGAHDVQPVEQARTDFPLSCGQCHGEVLTTFAQSVHGTAIIDHNNPDAASCSDCHGAHQIADPHTTEFRARSPYLCASCHADEELMGKYGISTAVFRTYVADFHGTTAVLFDESTGGRLDEAVCYDCHGAHDVTAINGAGLASLKQNLLQVCQQCHPGATANFPSAWLGHYEPTPHKYPAVFFARLFYMIVIPGTMAFFIIIVSWDMVHGIIQRVRSSRGLQGREEGH